jgi:hypothetical protein
LFQRAEGKIEMNLRKTADDGAEVRRESAEHSGRDKRLAANIALLPRLKPKILTALIRIRNCKEKPCYDAYPKRAWRVKAKQGLAGYEMVTRSNESREASEWPFAELSFEGLRDLAAWSASSTPSGVRSNAATLRRELFKTPVTFDRLAAVTSF